MSMIFERSDNETSCCPGCQYSCDGLNDTDIEWYVSDCNLFTGLFLADQ